MKNKLLIVKKGYPQKNLFGFGSELKGALGGGGGGGAWGALGTAANASADVIGNLANKGASNAVGKTFNSISDAIPAVGPYSLLAKGILKTAGIVANGFTNSVNEQQVRQKGAEINNFANQTSNATDYNQLQEDYNALQDNNIDLGKIDDWGGKGFLSSGSRRKNAYENAKTALETATKMRNMGLAQRGQNINLNNTMLQLQNLAAFGGPIGDSFGGALGIMQQNKYIDAINNRSNAIAKGLEAISQAQPTTFTNRFDAGGFVDSFMQDPVAAAMNYIKQRDAEEAQAEAQAAQEAREQAFADIQTRLLNAETQNQGLQALLEDQNRSIAALQEAQNLQEAAVSPTPSTAVTEPVGNNNTWDYIEGQLRRSGKFNDVQIEGIKYNLQRESALNPYAVGDNGEAFGLGQWHGSRQPKDRSLAGQTQHLIDTLSNYDGTRHWMGKSNYEGFLNARTPEEAHYWIARGYERPRADILAKVKRDSDMSLKRLRAFGGELGTNGTDFTNGLLQVNAGNTHERNPFGGVPMGLDPQGIPNLVEEGETVFNDYVFSKRLKVPNFMLEDLGLGGVIHKGKRQRLSFAEVSKKLAEESEMRPNDPISMNGLRASLSKLMEIQEAERMKEQAKLKSEEIDTASDDLALMAACGGKLHKYGLGGNIFDGRRRYNRMQRSSNVDTRSDTTRRGRHEGTLKGMQSSLIPLEDIWNAIDAETNFTNPDNPYYNPYLQTGVAPIAGRAGGYRTGSYNYTKARQAYSASRQAARNQTPRAAGNTRSAATATNTGRDYVQEANNTVSSRNLRTGQQWAENARSTPTVTQTRIQGNVKEGNHYASDFKGRTTQTSALNSKDATGRKATSRGDAVDPYAGLEGTLDFGSQRMKGWGWPIAIAAGLGTAGVGSYLYDESAEKAQEENPYLPQKTKSASGKKTVWYIPGHRNAGTFKSEKEAQEYYNNNLRGKQNPQQAQAAPTAPTSSSTPSVAASNTSSTRNTTKKSAAPATNRVVQNTTQSGKMGSSSNFNFGKNVDAEKPASNTPFNWTFNPDIGLDSTPEGEMARLAQAAEDARIANENASLRTAADAEAGMARLPRAGETDGTASTTRIPQYDTWMRYAPVVGSGIMALTDALGLTNKPDYTYADKLEAAANRAGYAPNINYNPIGEYLRYNPLDVNFYANQQRSTSAGNRRAILNSNASVGARNAMLLAQNYNDQNALGNLYRQADESNTAQRAQTADFNRRTDMANSQMALETDIANARYRQMASQMGLSGLAQAAAMRNDIDARTGAARAANLSNLFTSLGNIGRENMAFNMINSTNAARNGYWIDNEGVVHYVGKKDGLG